MFDVQSFLALASEKISRLSIRWCPPKNLLTKNQEQDRKHEKRRCAPSRRLDERRPKNRVACPCASATRRLTLRARTLDRVTFALLHTPWYPRRDLPGVLPKGVDGRHPRRSTSTTVHAFAHALSSLGYVVVICLCKMPHIHGEFFGSYFRMG